MGEANRISVMLSLEQSCLVSATIEAGTFASAEEVISQAIELWWNSRLIYGYTPEEIAALIAEGEASGEPIDGELAFESIRLEFERSIAAKSS
jgi:antitoxin ParD1/3/4